MQLYLYRRSLPAFQELFQRCSQSWKCFFESLTALSSLHFDENSSPYEALLDYPIEKDEIEIPHELR